MKSFNVPGAAEDITWRPGCWDVSAPDRQYFCSPTKIGCMSTKELKLKIRKFSFDMMGRSDVVAVIARRKSGKSFFIRDMLYHFRDMPVGTVISKTEKVNPFYKGFVPPSLIHDEYREEIIEKVLKRQRLVLDKSRRDPEYAEVDPSAFLLLDDCMADNSWQNSRYMNEIFYNGRHFKLLTMLSLQWVMGLKVAFRNQVDWVFLFKESIWANKKRLYENFAGMFPTQQIFNKVLDNLTSNFGCLVIHNGSSSNKLCDQIFWYRAEDRSSGDWRTCLDCFWDMDKNKDDDEEDDDAGDFSRRFGRNNIEVNVIKRQ